MPTLKLKNKELELKCSVIIDKHLNKIIQDSGEEKQDNKISGGFGKLLPMLIEQDVEALVHLWAAVAKRHGVKPTTDDIIDALDEVFEEQEVSEVFKEVLEAIEESNFSRNELAKFVKNMKLVSEMKSKDEEEADKMQLMLKRMDEGYEEITGRKLFETTPVA